MKRLAVLVEDSIPIANVFALMLRRLGFDVLHYEDGCVALKALLAMTEEEQRKVAILFSDVMMPNMCGIDLYKNLRVHAVFSKTPFVFSSAVSSPAKIREALELKCSAMLFKPTSMEKLTACLKQVLPEVPVVTL